LREQNSNPFEVLIDRDKNRKWWMFKDQFYWENENYTIREVKALILERLNKKKRKVDRAISIMDNDTFPKKNNNKRKIIPDEVKIFVWNRDSGKCVNCESNEHLEYDHIIPISKGGGNTARNIQLLCEKCNRSKGKSLI